MDFNNQICFAKSAQRLKELIFQVLKVLKSAQSAQKCWIGLKKPTDQKCPVPKSAQRSNKKKCYNKCSAFI